MPTSPKPLRIVLADDNEDAVHTLAKLLMISGYRVQAIAHDGNEALDAIRSLRPDVAILDIGMPELTGREVAKLVRQEVFPLPYLIALTGWGTEQERASILASGFDAHLTKPAELADIEAALRNVPAVT